MRNTNIRFQQAELTELLTTTEDPVTPLTVTLQRLQLLTRQAPIVLTGLNQNGSIQNERLNTLAFTPETFTPPTRLKPITSFRPRPIFIPATI